MMKCDEKCMDTVTRVERNDKSVIDYILINDKMYQYYESMEIDEDKLMYDLSDHVGYMYM